MPITRDTVKHIAKLSRLEISEEETDLFTGQLGQIVDYVEQLNTCETEGITPTSHPIPLETPYREDEVVPSPEIDLALKNAPVVEDGCFKVPRVIEEDEGGRTVAIMEADERRYETVIGLEVHCQLRTKTKIFCGCETTFGSFPNHNTCPVCLGMPGVLPVLNVQVVKLAIKTALATQCTVHRESIFARKNYFYPDLPKGYQISQFDRPLATDGYLEIEVGGQRKKIRITRIHLEEDAGKSLHEASGGFKLHNASLMDFNRTGVPLIETVSEPDMRSPDEAVQYLKELHRIVVQLGVCDGNMEQGSFRCDANVSIRPRGQEELGTRTELKNLNSFKFIHKALLYEIARHTAILDEGGKVAQETRLYNPDLDQTFSMRGKEEAHDYRYFPDPDLVPIKIPEAWITEIRESLPELPSVRHKRFVEAFQLSAEDAEMLVNTPSLADFFEATVQLHKNPKVVSNWITGDVRKLLNADDQDISHTALSPKSLAELLDLIAAGTISGKQGKVVLEKTYRSGDAPKKIVETEGLVQISDTGALEKMIDEILQAKPSEVEKYRQGQQKILGFFVGQIMKATQGKANPKIVNELLGKKLAP